MLPFIRSFYALSRIEWIKVFNQPIWEKYTKNKSYHRNEWNKDEKKENPKWMAEIPFDLDRYLKPVKLADSYRSK